MRYSMKASTPLAVTEQTMSGTSSPAAHTVVLSSKCTCASMANSRASRLTQYCRKQLPGPFDKSCNQLQQRIMINRG